MKKVRVGLKERSYDIVIGPELFKKIGFLLKSVRPGKDAVIITNRRLFAMYGKKLESVLKKSGFSVMFELVPDSEQAKSAEVATRLLNKIAQKDKYKNIFLVALGGGVVGDLTGFVASIYKRGIPYVQIPTTLLAQVDSAIGGKTAIDLPAAKNLAGAFYQPKIVISNISILKSLSLRRFRSAMAEIIKYGVIKDKALFSYLEKNYGKVLKGDEKALEYVISHSSKIKSDVVSKDEFDNKGLRIILNYGHTAGHAIEAASSYSGAYDHGESVAIGMVIAADIAVDLKLLSRNDAERIISLIRKCGLPTRAEGLALQKICNALCHDKKFTTGKNRFVLPVGIGRVKIVEGVPAKIVNKNIEGRLA